MNLTLHPKQQPPHDGINGYGMSCSLSRQVPLESGELRQFAADLMSAVSRACYVRGAKDVGHIKAYIEHAGGFLTASTVGDPSAVTVNGRDGGSTARFRLVLNAVVYGLVKPGVKAAAMEALEDTARGRGLSLEDATEETGTDYH